MAQSIRPGRFGQSSKPDDAWLAKQEREPILEPELPIAKASHKFAATLALWVRQTLGAPSVRMR
jgi:hypothetical protein